MKESCIWVPQVESKDGKKAPSKLFLGLQNLINDRNELVKTYLAATSKEWLTTVADEARFDENGEITLHSLIKLANLNFSDSEELQALNKRIGDYSYSFAEGLQKIRQFNQSEEGGDYLATLTKEGDNYKVKIVNNTEENRENLEAIIAKNKKIALVIDTLRQAGVSVDFIDNPEIYDGKFSTENAEETINGLLTLIQISKHNGNPNAVLIEEAAHFAIAALRNTPQVKRLLQLCKNKSFVKRMGVYSEFDAAIESISEYESAGRILAKALNNGKMNGFEMFFNKLTNFIRSIFAKINNDDLMLKKLEAERLALEIANDFYNGKSNVQTAIQTPMTQFATSEENTAASALANTKVYLTRISDRLKLVSSNRYKEFRKSKAIAKASLANVSNLTMDGVSAIVADAIREVVSLLRDEIATYETIKAKLPNYNVYDESIFQTELPKCIYSMFTYANELAQLKTCLDSKEIKEDDRFSDIILALQGIEGYLPDRVWEKCKNDVTQFAELLLVPIYGKDGIVIEGKIDWQHIAKPRTYKVSLRDIVEKFSGKDNAISRMLKMSVKLGDIAYSGLHEYMRKENAKINRIIVSEHKDQMAEIERLARDAGYSGIKGAIKSPFKEFRGHEYDLRELCEEDEGKLTGNFLSKYNLGVYFRLRKEIIDKIRKDCETYIKDNPDKFPDEYKKRQFIKDSILNSKKFNEFEKNSWIIEQNGQKHLNPDYEDGVYINKKYDEIAKDSKKIALLNALIEYKSEIDKTYLVDSDGNQHGVALRIPQVNYNRSVIKSAMSKTALTDTEAEFEVGSELQQNDEFEYQNVFDGYEDTIKRLPLQYIRRIKNPSTDLITSLKLYTTMAVRYSIISEDVTKLSLAQEILTDTDTNNPRRLGIEGNSNDYVAMAADMKAAIDKFLFGKEEYDKNAKGTEKKLIDDKALATTINTVATFIFICKTLLFNVPSMTTNALSAFEMWLKKSSSTNNYNIPIFLKNYAKALITNHKRLPILKHIGKKSKNIIYYINGLQGRRVLWGDLKKSNWIKSIYEDGMYLYGKGDEIAQQAIYQTVLEYKKVYRVPVSDPSWSDIVNLHYIAQRTKRTSLDNVFGEDKTRSIYLKDGFIKNKEDAKKYIVLKHFLRELNDAIDSNEDTKKEDEERQNNDGSWESLSQGPQVVYLTIDDIYGYYMQQGVADVLDEVLAECGIETKDESLSLKSLSTLRKEIIEAIDEIVVNDKTINETIDEILSESTEVQGLYYAGAKAKINDYGVFRACSLYQGYSLGAYNKNFNTGFNTLTNQYENDKSDMMLYTLKRLLKIFSKEGVYDKDTQEYRKGKIGEFLLILVSGLPVFHRINNLPQTKQILKDLGYTDQMISRMHEVGGDPGFLILMAIILGMFTPRNQDKAKKANAAGEAIQESAKYNESGKAEFDIDDLDKTAWQKLTHQWWKVFGGDTWKWHNGRLTYDTHIIFDLFNKPKFNDNKVVNAVQNRFNKTSGTSALLSKVIKDSPDKSYVEAVDNFADAIEEYAENLNSGKYESPYEAIVAACEAHGLSKSVARRFFYIDAVKKDSGKKTRLSFNEFIEKYPNLSPVAAKRIYNSLDAGETTYKESFTIDKYFDLYNPKDLGILADNIRATALKGVEYDKESPEYVGTSLAYYFIGRMRMEASSNASIMRNLVDVLDITVAPVRPITELYKSGVDIFDLLNHIDDDNFKTRLKKAFRDELLRHIMMESDDYGNISIPNPDELDSAHAERATGAKLKDPIKSLNSLEVYNEMK